MLDQPVKKGRHGDVEGASSKGAESAEKRCVSNKVTGKQKDQPVVSIIVLLFTSERPWGGRVPDPDPRST